MPYAQVVHDNQAMNMFAEDGDLLPWTEWRGFTRDVIGWVADHAGFTYVLHSPSGAFSSMCEVHVHRYMRTVACAQGACMCISPYV